MRTMFRISPQSLRWSGCLMILLLSGCCRTSGWVMNSSGMGYYQKGNYSMARNEFERAVIDNPRNPDYRHNLAMAMQKQGDLPHAEQVLRHNLTVAPMHQPTYHALTQILVSQQRTAEAEELVAGWRESQPYVPEAYVEQAWVQRETGNKAAAEMTLRQALQVKPNHPVVLAHLGQLYHDNGQTDQAAGYYQRSLLSRWNQPEVQSRLSSLTGTTSAAMNMRRSAMVHNEPVLAAGSFPVTDGFAVSQVSMPGEAVAMDQHIRPRRRMHRHRHDAEVAFPLPNFEMAGTGMGVISTADPSMMTEFAASPTMLPEIASQPVLAAPHMAATPTPIPQADPAHATDTAALPVVEPY